MVTLGEFLNSIERLLDDPKNSITEDSEIKIGRIEGTIVGYKEGKMVVRDIFNVHQVVTSRQECRGEEGLLQDEYILIECL